MRRIVVDGVNKMPVSDRLEQVEIIELDDGGRLWVMGRFNAHCELSAEGLAELANAITAWFMDDPREIVAQARKAVADLKEMLTDYNAEADRMGGEFVPFDRMHDRAEVIEHRLGELAKVFSATRRST